MAHVDLRNITKQYGDNAVVSDLNLSIHDGEFVVLVGPSGCGKSTTLRMIAGLETISSGELSIDGKVVNALAPKDRDIAMVFQNYALYAHMTVFDNVAFGLKLRRRPRNEIAQRVVEALQIVGMLEYEKRKPRELSGGQRQRVALARAIIRQPGVFLFDEPLSNLDAKLRVQMRMEIAQLQRRMNTTTIYVTHDQVEAMTMADRIAVLDKGILQQFDTPMTLYNQPANIFVAGFIGSPAMNFVEGKIDDHGHFNDISNGIELDLSGMFGVKPSQGDITLGIRPEDFQLTPGNSVSPGEFIATKILSVELMGNESIIYTSRGDKTLICRVNGNIDKAIGSEIQLFPKPGKVHMFDQSTSTRIELSH